MVVLDRALSVGCGGVLTEDVMLALHNDPKKIYSVIAGLGGRAITRASLREVFKGAADGTLKPFSFMDLDEDLVRRQLERERTTRKSGPLPEAVVRDAAMRQ